jgi:hypothetical protein
VLVRGGGRVVALVGVVLLVLVGGAEAGLREDRDAIAGDVTFPVDVKLRLAADPEAFEASAVALGAPPKEHRGMLPGSQALVVELSWNDSPARDGWFHLIALDKRLSPPVPLIGGGSWSAAGTRGPHWSSSFDRVAKRYDWLSRVGWIRSPDGRWVGRYSTCAVAARADRAGTVTAWWFNTPGKNDWMPLTDPAAEVALAVIHEEPGGRLNWVDRVFG